MSLPLPFSDRKRIRAQVIKRYLERAGIRGCVCFSCGNGSAYRGRNLHSGHRPLWKPVARPLVGAS